MKIDLVLAMVVLEVAQVTWLQLALTYYIRHCRHLCPLQTLPFALLVLHQLYTLQASPQPPHLNLQQVQCPVF